MRQRKVKVTVLLPRDTADMVLAESKRTGKEPSEIVDEAIINSLFDKVIKKEVKKMRI